jgi:2-desacetyl-2-hydroxyethyl bacteriochlorophyllide A dehydrogenase
MTATCRAAVFLGDGRHEIREFAVPNPPEGGALMRVEAVGLCGSDIAQYHGVEMIPGGSAFPVVPGHEIVGRIVALGKNAQLGVSEGQRVALDLVVAGTPVRVYGYSDMRGNGEVGLWGGYGEYIEILPGSRVYPLSDHLPAEQLTLFEPLANAIHWVDRAGVAEGDVVVVQGPGHQGLAVLDAVLERRPAQVIVTGTSQDKLRLDTARSLGATDVVMVDLADAVELVSDRTGGAMADVVLDISGAPQAVALSLELVRADGRILLAGLKKFATVPLVTDQIVMKRLTVVGGQSFTQETLVQAIEMIETGRGRSDLVIGEVLTIDEIDLAMDLLERKSPGRDAVRVGLRHPA